MVKEQQIHSLQKQLNEAQKEVADVKNQNHVLKNTLTDKSQNTQTKCPQNQYYGDDVVIFSSGSCEWAAGGTSKM